MCVCVYIYIYNRGPSKDSISGLREVQSCPALPFLILLCVLHVKVGRLRALEAETATKRNCLMLLY